MAYTAPTKSTRNAGAALLYHVQKNGKPRQGVISRGVNCTAEHARQEFAAMRKICGYHRGVEAYTDIISFGEEDNITKEQALDAACDAYIRAFPNTQFVASVHCDGRGGKTHVHFCRNNVDLSTGKRLKTANMLNLLKSKVDEVCKERGLSVIKLMPSKNKYRSYSLGRTKRYTAAEKYTKKMPWKQYIVYAIETNSKNCKSEDDFFREMARSGVTVTKRAGGYSYQTGSHKARGKKLGSVYDKDYLLSQFAKNAQKSAPKPTYKPTEAESVGLEILRGLSKGLSSREILTQFSAQLATGGEKAQSRVMEASNQISRGKLCLPVPIEFLTPKGGLDVAKIRENPEKFQKAMAKHAAKRDGEMVGSFAAALIPIPGVKSLVRKAVSEAAQGVLKASYQQGSSAPGGQGAGQKTIRDIVTGEKDSHAQLVATSTKATEPDDWFWLNVFEQDEKREEAARKRMY